MKQSIMTGLSEFASGRMWGNFVAWRGCQAGWDGVGAELYDSCESTAVRDLVLMCEIRGLASWFWATCRAKTLLR